jgi:hypothetical protein
MPPIDRVIVRISLPGDKHATVVSAVFYLIPNANPLPKYRTLQPFDPLYWYQQTSGDTNG